MFASAILCVTAAAALPAFAASPASGDFRGAVEVDGRKIHLECKGEGAPAVILISGYRSDAEIWTVEPGLGLTPVFAGVAGFTRVCAYDRPGTILDADHVSRSDPAPMPRTADAIVAELHGVLQASGKAAPYVLAAHSLGGLFARLYAATYPGEVAGMVLCQESSARRSGPPMSISPRRRPRGSNSIAISNWSTSPRRRRG